MNGYISPQKAFAHLDRLSTWQAGRKAAPVTIEIDLSNRCVLGCQDCHFAHTHVKGPWASKPRLLPMAYDSTGDLMDFQVLRRALSGMAHAGVLGVIWSGGGEPTTHPQWQDVIDLAASYGLEQGMYTCGGLLTEASGRKLAGTARWVVVSLDAADATTYGAEKGVPADRFDAACDGIKFLASAKKAVVGVSFLLHAANWRQADRMRRVGFELGASYVTFRPAIQTSPDAPATCNGTRKWIDDAWPTLAWLERQDHVICDSARFAEYRDWRGRSYDTCHGVKLTATMTPDGRLWICPQRRGVTSLGDLRKESFDIIWNRHVGSWDDFSECRVMCRLHLMNEQLAPIFAERAHEAFV